MEVSVQFQNITSKTTKLIQPVAHLKFVPHSISVKWKAKIQAPERLTLLFWLTGLFCILKFCGKSEKRHTIFWWN